MTHAVNNILAATMARWVRDLLLPAAAFLLMSGCGGGGEGSDVTTTPTAVAPSITTQPADQSVTAGQPASFSVAASGTAPLNYQWQRNGVAVAGANGATYDIAAATTADSGAKYTVVVSNSAGSATSHSATLAVIAATTVVTAAAGGQVTSDDGRVTLTIPPHALTTDSTVSIAPATDWTVPSALAGQFTIVAGTTHVISTHGGSFDAAQRFDVAVSTAGLLALVEQTRTRTAGKIIARAKGSGSGGNSNGNLGLVEDCGDGNPIIVIVPPTDGDLMGTALAGCPVGVSVDDQSTTVAVVTWTPPPSTPVASGNVLWETRAQFAPSFVPNTTRTYPRGDTWMGPLAASIAANSVGETEIDPGTQTGDLEQSLVTLVDGNGQLLAQELLPVKMTAVVLDGPANFYITLGVSHQIASYVSRYALQFSVQGTPSFVKLWERTLTGAPASGDGNDINGDHNIGGVEQSVVGASFAVDPTTGDLVGLAGNGSSTGVLTADEISRLNFDADGFLVRLDRSGNLVAATPVVALQKLSHANVPLDPQRFLAYTMRLDHAGNAYVASIGCCDATGQNAYGISGLTLKKIDRTGTLLWETPVASPDEVGLFSSTYPAYGTEAMAVDSDNNAYLTYYRTSTSPPPFGSHLYVAKIAATGAPSAVGYVTATVDGSGYGLMGPASYIDDSGVLYIALELGRGSHMVALDSSLRLIGTTPLFDPLTGGGFQVDSAGNIYEQQAIDGSPDWNNNPFYVVDLRKLHL